MKDLHQIVMAGTGGQGLVSMAMFLAEAAIDANLNTIQTQSYGVAQRGGFTSAEVLVSGKEILFQQVRVPDVVLVLHGVVGARYDEVKCPVIYDSTLVTKDLPNWKGIPCTEIATAMNSPRSANLVILGAMLAIEPVFSVDTLNAVIARNFEGKGSLAEKSAALVRKGFELASK